MAEEQDKLIKEISLPLFQSKGWMRFLGVIMVVYGVLIALTIVGILFAWLPIWMGVVLYQSANAIEKAEMTGQKEAVIQSLEKLKLYFIIMGVTMVVALVLTVLSLFLGMFGAMTGIEGMENF
ncbi:MAG: hypothetical protein D6819_07980 [Gammaproteobacteria bacterium]|nr:MAG: hypothetical protein D6819_07980 [Gammaproteobacteria bacterium]